MPPVSICLCLHASISPGLWISVSMSSQGGVALYPHRVYNGAKDTRGGYLKQDKTLYIVQGNSEYGKRVTDHDGSAGDRRSSL